MTTPSGGWDRDYIPYIRNRVKAKDEREALAMAEDAIKLVIEDCKARGN
jgi:hypothetical protein